MPEVNLGNNVTVSYGVEDITVGEKYEFQSDLESIGPATPGTVFIVDMRDVEDASDDAFYHCYTSDGEEFTLCATDFTTHLNDEDIVPLET